MVTPAVGTTDLRANCGKSGRPRVKWRRGKSGPLARGQDFSWSLDQSTKGLSRQATWRRPAKSEGRSRHLSHAGTAADGGRHPRSQTPLGKGFPARLPGGGSDSAVLTSLQVCGRPKVLASTLWAFLYLALRICRNAGHTCLVEVVPVSSGDSGHRCINC